jgi:PAS domain S-box-containing protein
LSADQLLHELQVHQIELEMQNEALRQAQMALEESRDRYVSLYEFAPVGYLTLNNDGLISEINLTGSDLLKDDRVSLIGCRFVPFVTPDDQDRWHRFFLQAWRHGGKKTCEMKLRQSDGAAFDANIDCVLVELGEAKSVLRVTLTDITQRKEADKNLALGSARYQLLLETAVDGLHILDLDGNLIEASDSFWLMLGYAPERKRPLNVKDWDASIPSDELKDRIRTLIEKPTIFETKHRRADGTIFDAGINCRGVKYDGRTYLYASSRDISDRKRLEDELRQSEIRYHRIFSDAKAAMLLVDPTTETIVDANAAASEFYGYDIMQLKSLHITDINILSAEDIVKEMHAADVEKRSHFLFRHRLASGEIRDVEVHSGPLKIAGRDLLFSIVHDVTDRRRAENSLLQRERDLAESQRIGHLGSWVMDVATQRLAWSDEMHRIFGVRREEFGSTYQDFISLVHRDDRAAAGDAYMGSLLEGGQFDIEYRVVRRSDGEVRWCHARCDHERDTAGQIIRSVGTVLDITERHDLEIERQKISEELLASAAQLQQVLETTAEGIVCIDIGRAIKFANPAAARILGWHSPQAMVGEHVHQALAHRLSDGQSCTEGNCPIKLTLQDGETRRVSNEWFQGRNNEMRPVEYVVSALKVSDEIIGLVVAFHDITERRTMEQVLKRTNAELEQFAYVASHDLRQPLRMITNYLALIAKLSPSEPGSDVERYLGYAVGGAKKMDRLIIDLLEYSRTGKSVESILVALGDVIGDALQSLRMDAREVAADILVADGLPTVLGDPMELTRLFQNLMGNAIKYCSADRSPKVEIGWHERGNEYLVWVKDNGMGIAPEHHDRAFQIFQRLVPKDAYEGSGIGLAICKKIVEHYGGQIWIESEIGQGSTFFMTFPIPSAAS